MVTDSLLSILNITPDEPVFPRITNPEVERLLRLGNGTGPQPSYVDIPNSLGDGRFVLPPGRLVSPAELSDLRNKVLADLSEQDFVLGQRISSSDHKSLWDRTLGASLLEHLPISVMQGNERGVWAYLTMFVFWDFPTWRYSSTPKLKSTVHSKDNEDEQVPLLERTSGGQRNVLRKCWIRSYVLGPNLGIKDNSHGVEHLKEDELVNVFERSTLGDNHELARAITRTIYKHRPSSVNRMNFTRSLTKQILRTTVSTHYSYLGAAMDDLLDEIASSIKT